MNDPNTGGEADANFYISGTHTSTLQFIMHFPSEDGIGRKKKVCVCVCIWLSIYIIYDLQRMSAVVSVEVIVRGPL